MFAFCAVQMADLLFERRPQYLSCFGICRKIKMLYFLFDDPISHGIDVIADYIAPHPVGLDKRYSSAHKWIGHPNAFKIIGFIERYTYRLRGKF